MPSSILFVHQGYELYGSDRTLLQSVQAAVCRWPEARITVLLPSDGPLRMALLAIVDDVRIADLSVLRKSNFRSLNLPNVGGFLRNLLAARRMIRAYEVTYINTVLILDYMLADSTLRRPCIVHVHEIPGGLAAAFLSVLLLLSHALVIFNSSATRRSFMLPFWQRREVVWNGVAQPPEMPSAVSHSKLHLLLIGRFNSWKGQGLLLRAVAQLSPLLRARLSVRLVGGVFGDQAHFRDELVRTITALGLSEIVEILPFTPDPYPQYTWADVIVVPSTKPEPFGLVAIEAMAAGRSVIAANHGGLSEIVVGGVTGSFVVPGSVTSLAAAIARSIEEPARIHAEGISGRKRFTAEFEESRYKLKIAHIIADMAGPAAT